MNPILQCIWLFVNIVLLIAEVIMLIIFTRAFETDDDKETQKYFTVFLTISFTFAISWAGYIVFIWQV